MRLIKMHRNSSDGSRLGSRHGAALATGHSKCALGFVSGNRQAVDMAAAAAAGTQ